MHLCLCGVPVCSLPLLHVRFWCRVMPASCGVWTCPRPPAPPDPVLHAQGAGPLPFPLSWWNVFWNVLPSVKGDLSCSSHILSSLAFVLEADRAVSPASVPRKLLPSRSLCPLADSAQMADHFLRLHAFLKHRFLSSRTTFCSGERAHAASSAVCGLRLAGACGTSALALGVLSPSSSCHHWVAAPAQWVFGGQCRV